MIRTVTAVLVFCIMLLPQAVAAQESWAVQLTVKQAKALAEIAGQPDVTAFAISPDGAWGRSWGVDTPENAAARAMNYCQAELRPGRRDCVLYEVAGRRVAPEVVATRKVSNIYKPVNGRKAAEVFGRVDFDFQGNNQEARAAMATQPMRRGDLPEDARLRVALVGRSIVSPKAKGHAIVFEDKFAEQIAMSNSGLLKVYYDSWTVTPDGLVCLFGGRQASTGAARDTNCLILNSASDGLIRMAWGSRPGTAQKMQLIAGDARYATAK